MLLLLLPLRRRRLLRARLLLLLLLLLSTRARCRRRCHESSSGAALRCCSLTRHSVCTRPSSIRLWMQICHPLLLLQPVFGCWGPLLRVSTLTHAFKSTRTILLPLGTVGAAAGVGTGTPPAAAPGPSAPAAAPRTAAPATSCHPCRKARPSTNTTSSSSTTHIVQTLCVFIHSVPTITSSNLLLLPLLLLLHVTAAAASSSSSSRQTVGLRTERQCGCLLVECCLALLF
jgi:hypothetical protein